MQLVLAFLRGALLAVLLLSASLSAGAASSPAPGLQPRLDPLLATELVGPVDGDPPIDLAGHLRIGELTTEGEPSLGALRIPVLLYHYIRINPNPRDRVGFGLSTTPAMFKAEMQYLADHDFNVISLHAAVLAIRDHAALPLHPVVLTFDDGYADFFTQAVPVLLQHHFTATDFVISGRIGWPGFLSAEQIKAADSMGFTIGAHTVHHVALAGMWAAQANWEMQQSKRTLEQLLGHPVIDFAYPYGSYNGYDMLEAQSLGFETAVSTNAGAWHTSATLMNLSRLRVGGGYGLYAFATLVGGSRPTPTELALQPAAPTT
jgi:peptidoglycan/xylan/chitin deacetylase (PgdA/CDA1 family)